MAERTGEQLGYGIGTLWGGFGYSEVVGVLPQGAYAAVVGSGAAEGKNPYAASCGWGDFLPGYGCPEAGTYATYDLMLAHPTIALARAAVVLPILAAGWKYEADEKRAPKGAKELIERVFSTIRTDLLIQMLRAIDVGCQAFEVVWGEDDLDGATVPTWFKPLLPAMTRAEVAKGKGRLLGLSQGDVKITAPGAWMWHAHDVKGTNWYGRGRLENARRQWQNWLADDDQGYRLSQKAAGIVPMVGHPADTLTTAQLEAKGQPNNNAIAMSLVQSLQQMRGVAYQNFAGFRVDDVEEAAKLADKSMWSFKTLDMGETGGAQDAITAKLAYRDKLLVRAYLRSERSVIEADTAGSRADAAAHTASIADTDADVQHALAVATINRQVVDAMLVENFGPKARGTAWIEPVQIVDERRAAIQQYTAAMLGDPLTRAIALEQVDMLSLIQAAGLKMRDNPPPIPDEMPTEGQEPPGERPGDDDEREADAA